MDHLDRKYHLVEEIDKSISFEKRLHDIGIEISTNSDLYTIGCKLMEHHEKVLNKEKVDEFEDIRHSITEVLGYSNFVNKLSPMLDSEYIDRIKPHLELLGSSNILQNSPSKISDQGSNKLFELYVAALCYPELSDIYLDHPSRSKGDNPDVTFLYNGSKWGIACKVLHSRNEKTIFDNIKRGIEQLNRSDIEKGFVLLNLKNIIDLDYVWPISNLDEIKNGMQPKFECNPDYESIVNNIQDYITRFRDSLVNGLGYQNILNLLRNSKSIDAVALLTETVTGVSLDNIPTPTFLGFLTLITFGELSSDTKNVISIINDKIN